MQHLIRKTIRLLLATVVASGAVFAFDYNLIPKQVSKSVWCFFGKLEAPSKDNGGFMSNSCYIKSDKSYIVVDSGPTYKFAEQSYRAMQKIANLPVSTAINTHYHDDHWLGNSFYKERFNSTLIGTKLQQASFKPRDKTRIEKMTSPEIYKDTKIVPLDRTVDKKETITIGKTKITIIPIGTKAHTPEDLFVMLDNEKVVFSGDVVMNGRISSNRDGSVLGQIKAHELIDKTGWLSLVPGHGFKTGKDAMDESKLYFKLLKERVTKAIDDDISAEDITKKVTLSEFKDKAMYNILNSRNIFDAYGELEFAE